MEKGGRQRKGERNGKGGCYSVVRQVALGEIKQGRHLVCWFQLGRVCYVYVCGSWAAMLSNLNAMGFSTRDYRTDTPMGKYYSQAKENPTTQQQTE